MGDENPHRDISFNNIRISSLTSTSGVFAGRNFQYLWHSDLTRQTGFGTIIGEGNSFESPYNAVTDPYSSSELLNYFEEQVCERFKKRGE